MNPSRILLRYTLSGLGLGALNGMIYSYLEYKDHGKAEKLTRSYERIGLHSFVGGFLGIMFSFIVTLS